MVRPAIGDAVLEAVRRGGGMVAVSDDQLLGAVSSLGGLADRSETVVLLVTGREVKVGGAPADLGRIAVVERLDEVERTLAGDR